jgi:hypothetical protein
MSFLAQNAGEYRKVHTPFSTESVPTVKFPNRSKKAARASAGVTACGFICLDSDRTKAATCCAALVIAFTFSILTE